MGRYWRRVRCDIGYVGASEVAMTLKQLAAEIYELHPRQRAKAMAELPESERWIVRTHIENMAKAGQNENRRRNAKAFDKVRRDGL